MIVDIIYLVTNANQKTTVRFTDDGVTEDFIIQEMDVAITVVTDFSGMRVQGWKDARIDLITDGAADATLSLFYIKHRDSQIFSAWDAER